ncbi:MAG: SIS domain-containing protein [Fimbriimonadaceae bacterium]|nr:SIS domain-containing protein [Fimbriimonadaceae bacterium]
MLLPLSERGKIMEHEIGEQATRLTGQAERYVEQLRQAALPEFEMVLLAARGSSDNAALYARYLIEVKLGKPVSMAAPSVWTRLGGQVRFPRCLVVGISQSGAAPDVAEVLEMMREAGHPTLAITNTPGSRLTTVADVTLLLEAGEERSIAATKTYTSTLVALYELVRAFAPDRLPAAALPNEAWVRTAADFAEMAAGSLVRSSPVFALGRGYSFSTAMETALKLMECALIPAKAYSSADFEHGPKALAGPGTAAISFDGDKPHLAENGCEVIVAPSPAGVADEIRPVWDVITGQWLALVSARARGLNPDTARFLRKVTTTH